MGGYFGNIEGTNIPADPRKRTKNHARLEITIWAEIPDEVFIPDENLRNASDVLRKMSEGFEESISDAFNKMTAQVPGTKFHATTRVSQ